MDKKHIKSEKRIYCKPPVSNLCWNGTVATNEQMTATNERFHMQKKLAQHVYVVHMHMRQKSKWRQREALKDLSSLMIFPLEANFFLHSFFSSLNGEDAVKGSSVILLHFTMMYIRWYLCH